MTVVGKFQHKIKITKGLWDSYRDFRNKYKLIYPDVDRKKYVNICHRINTALSDKIIKESFEFKMPFRLGSISIKKSKTSIHVKNGKLEKNKLIPDWASTWEYWMKENPGLTRKEINQIKDKVIIYNMNDHTNGYVMRWKWDKSTCNLPNHTVYQFKPTKRNRLSLAAWIKSDERENDYYLVDKYNHRNYMRLIKNEEKIKDDNEIYIPSGTD
jgi:hypothetical protein